MEEEGEGDSPGNLFDRPKINLFKSRVETTRGHGEEFIVLRSACLEAMDDADEDFCICRRCRSLSSSFSSASHPVLSTDGNISINKSEILPQKELKNRSQPVSKKIREVQKDDPSGDPQLTENCLQTLDVNGYVVRVGPGDEDVPLLLNDGCEEEHDDADHCHVKRPQAASARQAKRQLIISTFLCLCFMIAEVIGGYVSNSLAIMTDAAHLLSDLASFFVSLFAIWLGQKAPTRRMPFGYYRAEILGAVISVLTIWLLTAALVYFAVDRVRFPNYEIDANVMLITSGCGVAMNIIMGIVLHGSCGCLGGAHIHAHSHGMGQSGQKRHVHKEGQNINVRAALIHVLGDLVQSVGVMIAAYVIKYKPEYKLADPICTFIFSVLVLLTTIAIMRDAIHVLMEGFPRDLNYNTVRSSLLSVEGVQTAHSLHIWSLTVDKNTLSVHLAIEPDADPQKVLQEAQAVVRKTYGIYMTTIQVEKYNPQTMQSCRQCKEPAT